MAILQYISIQEVISKIYRDLNIEQEDRWVDMVEWCAEALGKIGAHSQYIEMAESLPVENYRATLPCGLYKITQIELNGIALTASTGSFDGTNNFSGMKSRNNFSYTVNDAFINTNFEQGEIAIAYIGVKLDADGFPMIPDDEGYKEAMLKYVVMKLKYPDYLAGKFPLYREVEVDWHRYCAQARGNATMPTLDDMESIKNQWVQLLPQMNRHRRFFNNLNDRERIAGNNLPLINR